jgi:phosphoribosylanthranilate isomerase
VLVGVFVDACAAEIGRVVKEVGLDAVQLHGLQTPAAAEVRSALGDLGSRVMLIRAIPVEPHATDAATGPEALGRAISRAREGTDLVLLDTRAAGRFGGSGRVFPWEIARRAAREAGQGKRLPFLVAGGIGPDNARAALVESGAWGVDVSSGVESAPGVKDHGLMRRLVAEVEEGRAP